MKIKMNKRFENFLAGFCLIALLFIFFFMGCSIRADVVIKDVNVGTDIDESKQVYKIIPAEKKEKVEEIAKYEDKKITAEKGLKKWGEVKWTDDKRAKEKERGIEKAIEVYPIVMQIENRFFWEVGTWEVDKACLWNIAAEPEVYGDPYMWPYIYAANWDQINDPDLIYPGQELVIVVMD